MYQFIEWDTLVNTWISKSLHWQPWLRTQDSEIVKILLLKGTSKKSNLFSLPLGALFMIDS